MVLDFDAILGEIGDFGRYQKYVVYLLCIPACFLNVFGVSFLFLGYTPNFLCGAADFNNQSYADANWTNTNSFRACSYDIDSNPSGNGSEKCTTFIYDRTYFKETVTTQWDLVCDRAIYPKTMMSLHSLVTLFGCLVNSYFQDLWGRKRAFFIVLSANIIGGISSVFAPNFVAYAVLRSLVAWSSGSMWTVSYTWALEYVGPSKRSMVTTIMCVIYGLAGVTLAGLAWLCDTWIKLTLASTLPFLTLYSFIFLVDESPRWLISKGRAEAAVKTIRKMAKWEKKTLNEEMIRKLLGNTEFEESPALEESQNGRILPKEEMVHQLDSKQQEECVQKIVATNKRNPRILDLFRTPNLRWKTCLITYCWAANLLTYYAIAYNMENIPEQNIFVTYTLQAAIEAPAALLIVVLLDRCGRIPSLSVSMLACGVLLFSAVPVHSLGLNPWIIVSLALAAKFGITLSFGILVQLAGESYPTQLRGVGTGFSQFVGTLGSIIMPYVVHSAKVYKMLPMVLMGITAVTSGLSVLMLPETMGRYMPETIAEAERGQKAGCAALKENWKSMRCCGRPEYSAVKKSQAGNGVSVRDQEEEDL